MPRRPLWVILTLLILVMAYSIPAAAEQDTGTRDALAQVQALKASVRIEANEIEHRERDKLTIARGDVRIQMENRELYADEVELDQVREVVRARGKVRLIEAAKRLEGDRFEYHYRDNTGTMYQGKGLVPPATVFQGVEIHKDGEREYRLVEGSFTTCRICQPEPGELDWEIRVKDAVLVQDEYLEANWASVWVRGMPSLVAPYLLYPIGPRRSGFLIPRVGYSKTDGFTYSQPYFWAIDESQDLTLTGVYRDNRGFEGRAIYRYILGPEARGEFDARIIQDRLNTFGDEVRGTIYGRHDQQFNPELSLKADVNWVSDRTIQREFAETPSQLRTASFASSRVFLTQMWDHYGLQFEVEESRALVTDTSDSTLRRLPGLSLSAFPQRLLDSPVFVEMNMSGTYLQRHEVPDGARVDGFPKASIPLQLGAWATMTPSIGFRETMYTKRGDDEGGGTTRELFEARVSLENRFFKSFAVGGTKVDRLVHLVEPHLSYWYINPVDQQELPQFDNVDFVSPQNRVTYSLTNRLLAKIKEADGSLRTHEVVSFSLSQSYNLDPTERVFSDLFLNTLTPERIDQAVREVTSVPILRNGVSTGFSAVHERRFSNLVADLRASPFQNLAFYGVTAFNTEENRVDGIEVGMRVAYPEYGRLEMAHSFIRGHGLSSPFNNLENSGVVGRLLLTPVKNVAINYLGRYDSLRDRSLENNVVVTYTTCCWMVGVHFVNLADIPGVRETENSFTVFFELLTGGVAPPPDRGARYLRR